MILLVITPTIEAPSTPLTAKHSSFLKEDLEGQNRVESLPRDEVTEEPHGTITRQKYTLQWWKKTWSDAIRVGRWPRVFYCALGFVFVAGWVGVMLGLVDTEVKYEQKNGKGTAHRRQTEFSNSSGTNGALSGLIMLKGSLVNFNVEKRALTVSWSGLYLYDEEKEPVELADQSNPNSTWYTYGIEIYRDISSTPYLATYIWYEDNKTYNEWSYQIDNVTAKPIGVIGEHPWDSFETDITFTQRRPKNAWLQPSLGYPLDQWQGQIVFLANNRWASNLFNKTGGAIMDVAGVQLADSTLNWRFTYEYEDRCNPADIQIDWNTEDIDTLPQNCHLVVDFVGKRPPLLIFCAIAAVA
ncbi:hypothetical protein FRB91_007394, partial [Serendipita sp. 411]